MKNTIHLITSQSLFTIPDISQSLFGEVLEIMKGLVGQSMLGKLYSYSRLKIMEPLIAPGSHQGTSFLHQQYQAWELQKVVGAYRSERPGSRGCQGPGGVQGHRPAGGVSPPGRKRIFGSTPLPLRAQK